MAEPWTCSICGAVHEGDIFDWGFDAPFHWVDERDRPTGYLDTDLCTIVTGDHTDHFVRGVAELPVDTGETFGIGAWVTLSAENFERYVAAPEADAAAQGEPWFGWFANRVPVYPETLNLKTSVQLRGDGLRPLIVLEPTEHPLARDQHEGITLGRARELSARWRHSIDA